jgi:hypothetical protein
MTQYGDTESGIVLSMPTTYSDCDQAKFVVITNPRCQDRSELIQSILGRLSAIISNEWMGAPKSTASRTPLRVLSTARHPRGQSMIAFKVFNASFVQKDAIIKSLQELSDVSHCGYEEGISPECFQ